MRVIAWDMQAALTLLRRQSLASHHARGYRVDTQLHRYGRCFRYRFCTAASRQLRLLHQTNSWTMGFHVQAAMCGLSLPLQVPTNLALAEM
jgi:hypothetical protein